MAERVYPSTKLNPPPAAIPGPPKPAQPYNQPRPRPVYRPQQTRPSRSCSGRRCCCLTFLYTLITLLIILLLAAITASIFYLLYHPKHPTFSVTSVRTTRFNLSKPDPSTQFSRLNSRVDITLTAKNPNSKKITFVYDPMTATVSAAGVGAGNGSAPGFTHVAGNTTVLHVTVASDPSQQMDAESVSRLRSDLKKKNGFPVTVELDTMVQLQMGKLKSKKVGVRVTCDGIKGVPPKNAKAKLGTPALTTSAKCKVDLRIKIWKFTF